VEKQLDTDRNKASQVSHFSQEVFSFTYFFADDVDFSTEDLSPDKADDIKYPVPTDPDFFLFLLVLRLI